MLLLVWIYHCFSKAFKWVWEVAKHLDVEFSHYGLSESSCTPLLESKTVLLWHQGRLYQFLSL
jgi:hypothetical protein